MNEIEMTLKEYSFKPKKVSRLKAFWYALTYHPRGSYSFKTLYKGRLEGKLFIKWERMQDVEIVLSKEALESLEAMGKSLGNESKR